MKTINEITEREYLLSIPAGEVLNYLKDKVLIANTYDFLEYSYRNDYQIANSTVEVLIKKNDRLIDIALCLAINNDEQIEKILKRNTKNLVVDSEILSAILSNREAMERRIGEYIRPWLEKRIGWIINSGSDEHIRVLFAENISIPDKLAKFVLKLKNKIEDDDEDEIILKEKIKINDERHLFIIVHLLINPAIQHIPMEGLHGAFLGYGANKRELQSYIWNLLLTLPVNEITAYNISLHISSFHSLNFTHEFENSVIPFDSRKKDIISGNRNYKKDDIEFHKAFIDKVITRWESLLQDFDDKGVREDVDNIKKHMIQKIDSHTFFLLEDYLLEKNDAAITEGFFSNTYRINFHTLEIFNKFEKYLKKYGRLFLLGLMNHDQLFLKSGYYEIQIKIYNAIFNFKEPKTIREYSSLEYLFDSRAGELSKKNPESYIKSQYDEFIDNKNEETPDDKFLGLYEKLESHFKDIKEDNDNKENQKEIINYLSDIQSNYIDLENKNIDASQRIEERQYNYYEKILGLQSDASIFLIIIIILLIIVIIMLF